MICYYGRLKGRTSLTTLMRKIGGSVFYLEATAYLAVDGSLRLNLYMDLRADLSFLFMEKKGESSAF